MQFFHERELHATFFGLCRHQFQVEETSDAHQIQVFRYEYESVWKYARHDPHPYTERLTDRGTTACLDFAVLRAQFVQNHDLLTVINKDEARRHQLRQAPWVEDGSSLAIEGRHRVQDGASSATVRYPSWPGKFFAQRHAPRQPQAGSRTHQQGLFAWV